MFSGLVDFRRIWKRLGITTILLHFI